MYEDHQPDGGFGGDRGVGDSYYIPDDYYSDESGYDSDMFKKCWEDDF
jgi:hypothetical protein